MSAQSLRNNWHKYSDQGMRIVDIEVCPAASGGGIEYAAVWRENDDRYDWAGRQQAEQALAAYAGNSDIPALARRSSATGAWSSAAARALLTSRTTRPHTAARSIASRQWPKP